MLITDLVLPSIIPSLQRNFQTSLKGRKCLESECLECFSFTILMLPKRCSTSTDQDLKNREGKEVVKRLEGKSRPASSKCYMQDLLRGLNTMKLVENVKK